MKHSLFSVCVMLLAAFTSCKKDDVSPPAVVARVYSVSYPPGEDNYTIHTASVELKKTDGSYYDKKYVSGTGELRFENLTPGEYWINEETTRQSEKFMLGAEETQTIDFTIP